MKNKERKSFSILYGCALSKASCNLQTFSGLGELNNECSYCSALYFKGEKNSKSYFNLCSCNKKFQLPEFCLSDDIKSNRQSYLALYFLMIHS